MNEQSQDDKRKFYRVPKKIWVMIASGEFAGLRIQSEDLSLGGVLIKTRRPLRVGEEILLKLKLFEDEDPVEVKGKVVSIRANNEAAIEFVEADPAATRSIWKHLIENKK